MKKFQVKLKAEKCSNSYLIKLLRIMKISILLFLIGINSVYATKSYSQTMKLSMNMKNVTVEQVLNKIEAESEFYFLYNHQLVDVNRKVNVKFSGALIKDILDNLFAGSDVKYVVMGRQIILSPERILNDEVNHFNGAQGVTITGKVTDEKGESIPGVNVIEKGTTNGTITDTNGSYTLTVSSSNVTLQFSFIGYQVQEVSVNRQTVINVTLKETNIELEEVISTGYAMQKKADIVGAVTSVSGDKIASIPSNDLTTALSGRLPGATIIQQSGEPGQDQSKILVRGRTTLGGNTAPLVVIDGIPGRSLSEVDPVDIASISILKDAAAAIYGSSAANGVILVTTKKGTQGLPKITYQFFQGFMKPTLLPEVLNAGDYATMLSEYQDYENRERTYSDRDIELFYSGRDPWEHPNTDWMGELIAKHTSSMKHNVSIEGGNKGRTYFVSFGYRNQDAIYKAKSTNYKQYNLRANLNIPITKWLRTSFDYAGYVTSKLYPTKSASAIYGQATRLVPTQWAYWPTGEPGPDIEYGDNPVVTSTFETGTDDTKSYKNQTKFLASLTPVKGLSIDVYYTFDFTNSYRKRFQKPWILYFPQWDTAVRDSEGFITSMDLTPTPRGVPSPQLTEYYDRYLRQLWNSSFTYDLKLGDHSLKFFGAYEQLQEDWNNFGAFRKDYISDVVQTLSAGADEGKDNWGGMGLYARKSWIGRINYNYKNKYLAEFIFRRDGSLKFPPDSRWGNFPGLLLGWRMSEESFWKNSFLGFMNYFKLRGSFGKMGMDPGAPFQYMNKYVLSKGMTFGSDKVVETVVQQAGVANPHITWEKQTTYNAGFDAQLFDNMFHLNTEFFWNTRSDILAPRNASVPAFTGLQLPDEIIAEVKNHGFEIDAGYHYKGKSSFRFDVTGNVSFNRNQVVFMDEPERAVPWQQRTGHPYGAVLMYNAIGVFADQQAVDNYPHWSGAKPGDVIFEDVSGDGVINSDDKILLDKADAPELFYGLTLDASIKNFTLSILFQGQGSYYRMNIQDGRRGEAGNYFKWSFENRWTPENIHTDIARAYNRGDLYWAFQRNNSTYHWDNMAYCRLKNIMLSYNLPKSLLRNLKIQDFNVFFSGNNLALIYAAQHNFDPEIGRPMTYPAVRTLAIGAKITF
jgi:TonB-linked SusC/RagA family outer membrane protein